MALEATVSGGNVRLVARGGQIVTAGGGTRHGGLTLQPKGFPMMSSWWKRPKRFCSEAPAIIVSGAMLLML